MMPTPSSRPSVTTGSMSSPSLLAARWPRPSWSSTPNCLKLVLTGTGPKGGKGIDKVAWFTYRDMLWWP